jgi:ParB family chromosome partitioning protein
MGFRQLMEEFGHTQEKVAAGLGKSRSHVANMVRLLTLPQNVQNYLREGKLTMGHARALITADNPEDLAKEIIQQGLTVRDVEALTGGKKKIKAAKKAGNASGVKKDIDTLALETEISNILGMGVTIDMKTLYGGALKIEFKTLDQLDDILHRLSHFPGRQQTG